MSKLKKHHNAIKFPFEKEGNKHKTHVSFSYAMLTDDKRFTFECFKVDLRECISARTALDDLLAELSNCAWVEIQSRNKYQRGGFESFPLSEFNESIYKRSDLTPEVSVIVFRFGGNKYRMIGYKYQDSDVFYILGYDFRYSAYDHGF